MRQVRVYPTRIAAAQAAAAQFVAAAERAHDSARALHVALSGGNTPRDFIGCWRATNTRRRSIGCIRRSSGATSAAFRSTTSRITPTWHGRHCSITCQIPMDNIHRVQSELPPEAAAAGLRAHAARSISRRAACSSRASISCCSGWDAEGHTASLFPDSPALHEQEHWVAARFTSRSCRSWRITLTPVALNAATKVIFLVVGEEKAQALKQVLSEPKQPDLYPAQIIDPPQGQVLWIADKAAAHAQTSSCASTSASSNRRRSSGLCLPTISA